MSQNVKVLQTVGLKLYQDQFGTRFLECADLSALAGCDLSQPLVEVAYYDGGDRSPLTKAVTGHRTPKLETQSGFGYYLGSKVCYKRQRSWRQMLSCPTAKFRFSVSFK